MTDATSRRRGKRATGERLSQVFSARDGSRKRWCVAQVVQDVKSWAGSSVATFTTTMQPTREYGFGRRAVGYRAIKGCCVCSRSGRWERLSSSRRVLCARSLKHRLHAEGPPWAAKAGVAGPVWCWPCCFDRASIGLPPSFHHSNTDPSHLYTFHDLLVCSKS